MDIFERIEFGALCLYGASLCVAWRMGVVCMVLWVLAFVERRVAHRGEPQWGAMPAGARWGAWLMAAYFAVYAVSGLYSANGEETLSVLGKMLPLLVMPVCALCGAFRRYEGEHVRAVLYCVAATLSGRFVVRLCVAVGKAIGGAKFTSAFFSGFDPMHHAYLAMYTLLVVVFVYNELWRHGTEMPRWQRVALESCGGVMLIYTYLIQSRAGVLCMGALVGCLVLHLIFRAHRRKQGLTVLAVGLVALAAIVFLPKGGANRLGGTVEEVSEGNHSDVRFEIWGNALGTVEEHLPFGAGVGDRMDALVANYPVDDTTSRLKPTHIYNPHNQYLDTLLATGVPGMALLLALLLLPVALRLWRRGEGYCFSYLLPFVLIVALSAPFESILQRQMGILFFAFFYLLFFVPQGNTLSSIPSPEGLAPRPTSLDEDAPTHHSSPDTTQRMEKQG